MAPVALPRVIPAILIPAAVIHAVPPGKARVAPVALTHAVRRAKACVAIRTRRPAQVRVALATLTHAFPVGSTHAVPTAMARVAIRVVPLVRIHAATPAHAERRYLAVHSQTRSANPIFNLATGREASAGQDFLEALGFIVRAACDMTARTGACAGVAA